MCLHAGGILLCFFFKQKTAYEVRISDWSSDVCSSDLRLFVARLSQEDTVLDDQGRPHLRRRGSERRNRIDRDHPRRRRARRQPGHVDDCRGRRDRTRGRNDPYPGLQQYPGLLLRSEEHTSELQSLMRISYAVFCLKKKKNQIITISRK